MTKLSILIFQTGEPLHIDGGDSRPMRAINLSNFLLDKGHSVHLVSSKFYHQKKIHRTISEASISSNFKITLIDSPGYKKNISISRIIDHIVLAINVNKFLESKKFNRPDVIFVGYPPIECAYIFTKFCKNNDIPLVLDVKDQWPEYFLSAIPTSLHFFGRFLLSPYYILASISFSRADLIISMSKSYLKWVNSMSKKTQSSGGLLLEVPLTRKESTIKYDRLLMMSWWLNFGVNISKTNCISFVGSLSQAFDFRFIKTIAEKSLEDELDLIFVICGDGEESTNVKELMAGLSNVIFPGWVGDNQIDSLMDATIATMAPYKVQANFSDNIPNKVVDSLFYGKPILTSLSGEVSQLIALNKVGIIWDEDADIFYRKFKVLISDEKMLNNYSLNAKMLYKNKFEFDLVYSKLSNQIENLAATKNSGVV